MFIRWIYGVGGFAIVCAAFFVALVVAIAGPPNQAEANATLTALHQVVCTRLPNELHSLGGCPQTQFAEARSEPQVAPTSEPAPLDEIAPDEAPPSPELDLLAPSLGADLEGDPGAAPVRASSVQAAPSRAEPAREATPRRATRQRVERRAETQRRVTRPARRATAQRTTRPTRRVEARSIPRLAESARVEPLPDAVNGDLDEVTERAAMVLEQELEPEPDTVAEQESRTNGPQRGQARAEWGGPRDDPYSEQSEDDEYSDKEDVEQEYADAPADEDYYEYRPRRRWRRGY